MRTGALKGCCAGVAVAWAVAGLSACGSADKSDSGGGRPDAAEVREQKAVVETSLQGVLEKNYAADTERASELNEALGEEPGAPPVGETLEVSEPSCSYDSSEAAWTCTATSDPTDGGAGGLALLINAYTDRKNPRCYDIYLVTVTYEDGSDTEDDTLDGRHCG